MTWPAGFASASLACGIKSRALDVGVLAAEEPVPWAGVFTTNAAAAAPVTSCRARLGTPVRALIVNSGNANACTGPAGEAAVATTAAALSAVLDAPPDGVLVASTGPIGVPLPVDRIVGGLDTLDAGWSRDPDGFARAIMTTDTRLKIARRMVGPASIVGVAKGAAMIAPNMATMLGFIATDASLSFDALQAALGPAVGRSFNRISVDACESTNDSVFLLASGRAGPVERSAFEIALGEVCADLARAIVEDAEGGSRLVTIEVSGAASEEGAVALGRGVATSALWRAAIHGGDPNWGRVLAALGSVDRNLDLDAVVLSIGPEVVFAGGGPAGSLDVAAKAMEAASFTVRCEVGSGPGSASILTSDLSEEYVTLNSEVTT